MCIVWLRVFLFFFVQLFSKRVIFKKDDDIISKFTKRTCVEKHFIIFLIMTKFYCHFCPRPVLPFRYCRCLRLPVPVSLSVCVSVHHQLVRAIFCHPFMFESANLDNTCKTLWFRSLLFWGLIDLDIQDETWVKIYFLLIWSTLRLTTDWHDDVIKWKHFPRHWPLARGIHRSPVNSPHKGQWRGALMFSLIFARMNGWLTIVRLVIWDAMALIMTSL